ncbi:MAG: hypothetical protein GX456_15580 [Verrucomicrobia bacterium]|nr:hypothetical protein [Verrucomicrobiota bacterium]
MGVSRREALGVRQLPAALSLCPNNVSVPISASEGFLRRLRQPPIGTRDNVRGMPQSGGKTQTPSLAPYPAHCQRPYHCDRLTDVQRTRTEKLSKLAALKSSRIRMILEYTNAAPRG